MLRIALLGTGLIGRFYAESLHGKRSRDRVHVVYSCSADRARAFAVQYGIHRYTTKMEEAITDADVVIIGVPNHLHEQAAVSAAKAGKAAWS